MSSHDRYQKLITRWSARGVVTSFGVVVGITTALAHVASADAPLAAVSPRAGVADKLGQIRDAVSSLPITSLAEFNSNTNKQLKTAQWFNMNQWTNFFNNQPWFNFNQFTQQWGNF
jgi:hypothetical protein